MAKKKLAVLGGGMGALSAIYHITEQPGWEDEYEITVYQMGWRLGGKGASGRDQSAQSQIQEHGYHALFGFYQNTLSMMKKVYEQLGRNHNQPFSEFLTTDDAEVARHPDRYAMRRAVDIRYYTPFADESGLEHTTIFYPPNKRPISSETDNTFIGTLQRIWSKLQTSFDYTQVDSPTSLHNLSRPSWWSRLETLAPGIADLLRIEMESFLGPGGHLNGAGRVLAQFPNSLPPGNLRDDYLELLDFIAQLLRDHLTDLWSQVKDNKTDWNYYHLWIRQDFLCTMFIGLIDDRLMVNGYDSINDQNFYNWFKSKGTVAEGTDLTVSSIVMESVYNFGFAFAGGDTTSSTNPRKPIRGQPDAEAGTILRVTLRWILDYYGGAAWLFQAACGDVLFAPLYELLNRRGVRFKFFHKVRKLEVSADGEHISKIQMVCQAKLAVGQYNPLILVDSLPCWPNEPLYDQLADGAQIRENGINFESTYACEGYEFFHELTYKKDYDMVLLNIAPGAFPIVAEDLLTSTAKPEWGEMYDHLKLVQTEGLQIRLNKTAKEMGWGAPFSPLYMVGIDDLNTVADMSHQIERENWPAHHRPKSFFYFVSVMRTDADHPPYEQCHPNYVKQQQELVEKAAIKMLNNQFIEIFPQAAGLEGDAAIWNLQDYKNPTRFPAAGQVNGAVWNDDEILVLVWSNDGAVRIWLCDDPEAKPLILQHKNTVLGAQWYAMGLLVLTWCDDGVISLWWLFGCIVRLKTFKHDGPVLGAILSDDYTEILSWSEDKTVRIWSTMSSDKAVWTGKHSGTVTGATWSHDKTHVLSWSADSTARVWLVDGSDGPYILRHDDPVNGATWSQDEQRVLTWSEDATARIWDYHQYPPHEPYNPFSKPQPIILPHNDDVISAAWSGDEERILTSSRDWRVRVWIKSDPTYSPEHTLKHDGPLNGATWGKEEKHVLSWANDATARIWKLKDKSSIVFKHDGNVLGARWDNDKGRVLSWSDDDKLHVWHVSDARHHVLSKGSQISDASWSQDEDHILAVQNRTCFDWNLLVDPEKRHGVERLKAQYWRANINPSDLYVLSAVNTSKYRLRADESGYHNLILTGDWIQTGINVGCMEGAVMGGMQASRALTGFPAIVPGELDFDPTLVDKPRLVTGIEGLVVTAVDTGVDVYGRLAKAIAEGLIGFRDEVSVEKLTNRSLISALWRGTEKGGGNFIREINQLLKHVGKDLAYFGPDAQLRKEIDYEKLAKLVAEELVKQRSGK